MKTVKENSIANLVKSAAASVGLGYCDMPSPSYTDLHLQKWFSASFQLKILQEEMFPWCVNLAMIEQLKILIEWSSCSRARVQMKIEVFSNEIGSSRALGGCNLTTSSGTHALVWVTQLHNSVHCVTLLQSEIHMEEPTFSSSRVTKTTINIVSKPGNCA